MLKTFCCCYRLRRESNAAVTSGSINAYVGDPKPCRALIQTAPNRFISVVHMMTNFSEAVSAAFTDSRPQRNGRVLDPQEKDQKEGDNFDQSHGDDLEGREADNDKNGHGKATSMVVVADVERPKTGDTVSSKVSLPPLRSGSAMSTTVKKKKLKWNLKKRTKVASMTENEEPKIKESPNMVNADEGDKEIDTKLPKQSSDAWIDEIVPIPNSADRTEEGRKEEKSGRENSNVVIFFLHGVGGCSLIWTSQMKSFYGLGYNVVAVDLIGHGDSPAPTAKAAYDFESIKLDILQIFDRFAGQKNVIVAHSYGTCFAAVLARERSDKISHLVLISSGAPVPLDSPDGIFALPTPALSLLRPAMSRKFMKLAFLSAPSLDDFNASFGLVKAGVLKRIMQGQRWSDCTFLYHQLISTPTLLMYGADDGLVSLSEMHEMRKAIPGSALEVIDQAAHMVMLEQSTRVNRLIAEFLKKAAPIDRAIDEEKREHVSHGRRLSQRPPSATSRTIPPADAFKFSHGSVNNVKTHAVAVS